VGGLVLWILLNFFPVGWPSSTPSTMASPMRAARNSITQPFSGNGCASRAMSGSRRAPDSGSSHAAERHQRTTMNTFAAGTALHRPVPASLPTALHTTRRRGTGVFKCGSLDKAVNLAPAAFNMYERDRVPWFRPEDHAHLLDGLRKSQLGGVTATRRLAATAQNLSSGGRRGDRVSCRKWGGMGAAARRQGRVGDGRR
jgi:hypothetical protein